MKTTHLVILFLSAAGGLALVSTPRLHHYRYSADGVAAGFTRNGRVHSALLRSDLDLDEEADEIYLTKGRLEVRSGVRTLFSSNPEWEIKQAEFGDLNGDGEIELVMLVWREFQPWPVDRLLPAGGRIAGHHDVDNRSCHLILMGWSSAGVKEVWAGSALADPVLSFAIGDLDGDGRQELVTRDGVYDHSDRLFAKAVKIWEWNGFGFSRLEQIELPASQILITEYGDGSRGLIIATQ